jgi:hypothetical protein
MRAHAMRGAHECRRIQSPQEGQPRLLARQCRRQRPCHRNESGRGHNCLGQRSRGDRTSWRYARRSSPIGWQAHRKDRTFARLAHQRQSAALSIIYQNHSYPRFHGSGRASWLRIWSNFFPPVKSEATQQWAPDGGCASISTLDVRTGRLQLACRQVDQLNMPAAEQETARDEERADAPKPPIVLKP